MPTSNAGINILLHDHIDGAFPLLGILHQLHHMSGKKYPLDRWARHHEQIKEWFLNGGVHENIVEKFSLTTGVMQDLDTIMLVAETYVKVRARQGIKYCEVRYAPQYSTFLGLREDEVIRALIRGIKKGEREFPEIEVNLIASIGREVSSFESERLVAVIDRVRRETPYADYIVGIDLVCNEAQNPPEKHLDAFRLAKRLGLKTICHAGEWVIDREEKDKDSPDKIKENLARDLPQLDKNIRTAVFDLKVDRIGHAIGLGYDSELMRTVIDKGIGIELCPGSNLVTGLISDIKDLKIKELLGMGVLCSLNPDDDLFLPDINSVFEMYQDAYYKSPTAENLDLSKEEKKKLIENAWKTRFGNRKQHSLRINT